MRLVLHRAEINEREITLEIYALNAAELSEEVGPEGDMVRMRPEWLPGLVPQSVAWDRFPVQFPSLVSRKGQETRSRISIGSDATVADWRRMLDEGIVVNRAQLARRLGVSRARVTRVLGSMNRTV